MGIMVPEEYQGSGLGNLASSIIVEEVSVVSHADNFVDAMSEEEGVEDVECVAVLEATVPAAVAPPTDDDIAEEESVVFDGDNFVEAMSEEEGDEMSVDRGGVPTAELGAASEVDVEDFLAETLSASGPEGGVHMGVVVGELERLGIDIELVACFMASPRFAEVYYVEGECLFRVGGADI